MMKKKQTKQEMAAALSPWNREKIVVTDTRLSFIVHPVQYTEVRLASLKEEEALLNDGRLPVLPVSCTHSYCAVKLFGCQPQ